MFEFLPVVTKESGGVFATHELEKMVENLDHYMDLLRARNENLAVAILLGAEFVAADCYGELKEVVEARSVAVQMGALRLVERPLEAKDLEDSL